MQLLLKVRGLKQVGIKKLWIDLSDDSSSDDSSSNDSPSSNDSLSCGWLLYCVWNVWLWGCWILINFNLPILYSEMFCSPNCDIVTISILN